MIPDIRATMDASAAALREKQGVALSSVIAAVVLTVLKLSVGLSTDSLGILAEAAHSGLDLIAALMTLLAVRIADREADETHRYGHGRFENISALFETVLLLVTCFWVIGEAIDRLGSGVHHVEPTIWGFGVMAFSIVVDWSRSRALSRAAKKHDSQALEADALHFSTDIWSSAVVILGLALVWLGDYVESGGWLERADAIAALLVAGIVIWVSARLGWRTIQSLADAAPPGMVAAVRESAMEVDGVSKADRIRLRRAGNKLFIDLVVSVPRTTTFASAHTISEAIEDAVMARLPNADVVVHVEPAESPGESANDRVQYVARQRGVDVHDIRVRQVGDRMEVDLHVEVDPNLKLADAHAVATDLEANLLAADDRFSAINTHLEAPEAVVRQDEDVTDRSAELIARIASIADQLAGADATHEVRVYRSAGLINLVLHASFRPDLSIEQVHQVSAQIERALRLELDDVGTILVHAEPRD